MYDGASATAERCSWPWAQRGRERVILRVAFTRITARLCAPTWKVPQASNCSMPSARHGRIDLEWLAGT